MSTGPEAYEPPIVDELETDGDTIATAPLTTTGAN